MEPLDQLVSSWIMPPVWLSRRFMAQSPFAGEYILVVTSELGSDVAPKTGTSDRVYRLVQSDHICCPSAPFIGPHEWENCLVKVTHLWSWQLTRCWRHSGVSSFQPNIDLKGFLFLSLCVKRLKFLSHHLQSSVFFSAGGNLQMEGRHFGVLRRPLSILIMEDIELPRRERCWYIKLRLYLRCDKYTRQSVSNRCGRGRIPFEHSGDTRRPGLTKPKLKRKIFSLALKTEVLYLKWVFDSLPALLITFTL